MIFTRDAWQSLNFARLPSRDAYPQAFPAPSHNTDESPTTSLRATSVYIALMLQKGYRRCTLVSGVSVSRC